MTYARPAICVIGGGFTGAAAAIACLKRLSSRSAVRWSSQSLGPDILFP
jgi:glycine/D-amino acid oxidase-like deaminating enzyme